MQTIDATSAYTASHEGRAVLVDVRSEEERSMLAPRGAIHVPLEDVPRRAREFVGKGPVYFICRSGGRSAMGASLASSVGVEAFNVAGGMIAWSEARLPLEGAGGAEAGFAEGRAVAIVGGVLLLIGVLLLGGYYFFGCPSIVCASQDLATTDAVAVPAPSGLLGPSEFQLHMNRSDVQLVDVRTAEEFASGHLQGARLIDFRSPSFLDEATRTLDPSRPVYLYCRSGNRSGQAAELLRGKGYQVADLKGGVVEWSANGQEIVR